MCLREKSLILGKETVSLVEIHAFCLEVHFESSPQGRVTFPEISRNSNPRYHISLPAAFDGLCLGVSIYQLSELHLQFIQTLDGFSLLSTELT